MHRPIQVQVHYLPSPPRQACPWSCSTRVRFYLDSLFICMVKGSVIMVALPLAMMEGIHFWVGMARPSQHRRMLMEHLVRQFGRERGPPGIQDIISSSRVISTPIILLPSMSYSIQPLLIKQHQRRLLLPQPLEQLRPVLTVERAAQCLHRLGRLLYRSSLL